MPSYDKVLLGTLDGLEFKEGELNLLQDEIQQTSDVLTLTE